MNIKNRLEKLESTKGVKAEYCSCQKEIVTRVIVPDRDRTDEEIELLFEQAQRPEKCLQCRMLMEKRLILVQPHGGDCLVIGLQRRRPSHIQPRLSTSAPKLARS